MEYIDEKMNTIVKLLKKTDLISVDFIYRYYFMSIFGLKLYYKHKIASFRSCAFCKHLSYDKVVKKYICSHGEYEACNSIVPCIIPEPALAHGDTYIEEDEETPWLFKKPCHNFEVLDQKNYFRNFLSFNMERSIINLEALEGILLGSCGGELPCHLCACVRKEAYTKCTYVQKANELGKCGVIYGNLKECFNENTALSNVS